MSEPSQKRSVAVGIFIIVGILFLVGGILAIGNLHTSFSRKLTVTTVFTNVNGLVAGNNIWFSGVKVGTVGSIEFTGKSDVLVSLNISLESRGYIRKDAKVKISSDGLIGNKILVISGGTAGAAAIADGDMLMSETALNTEDIMSTLQENNMNILRITSGLASGEGTIGKLLQSDSVYNSITTVSRSLEAASANTAKMIASMSVFAADLNREGGLAHDLVTDTVVFDALRYTAVRLQDITDSTAAFVSSLKAISIRQGSPADILLKDQQAGAEIKTTLSNLRLSSEKLNTDLEALQHSFLLRGYFRKQAKAASKKP